MNPRLREAIRKGVTGERRRHTQHASARRGCGLPILYISTDYVFDGEKYVPYLEDDETGPIRVYGRSKPEGEKHVRGLLAHLWTVRTSRLFDPKGKDFVQAILEKAHREGSLRVVNDQLGAPTYTMDLARKPEEIIARGGPGICHVTKVTLPGSILRARPYVK